MDESESKPIDVISAHADRLEKALADLEARKKAAAEWTADNAPQFQRLEALQAKLDALPQKERREVLDAMGLHRVSAAPKPIEPVRSGGLVGTQSPKTRPPRWPLWQSVPRVALWQAVLLSLDIEPDEALKQEACAAEPTSHLARQRLPREFFARRQDCLRALTAGGPIRPQGPLYGGMLQDPKCSVLLAEVAAFMASVQYEVPTGMRPNAIVSKGALIKRSALIEKHERTWRTIDRDLRDASANGLSEAAKAEEHGMWFEAAALAWAEKEGKYVPPSGVSKARATPFRGLGEG